MIRALALLALLGGCTVPLFDRADRAPATIIAPDVYTKAETDAINAEITCRRLARTPLQAVQCGVRR